ncbi:MAG: efflux RND transporter periplasmic adaptor subunit [Acidobacteria bacterium]|nr:efflux RND transporter periplasmic adaptor subunit [Acidobacteriota bacterium]MBS1866309.1 efflux RND transporter periplasmic adaptor subunit [Acidobacteriota bacterium]
MPAADLSSLKIHDSARSKGSAGKFLSIFAAVVGAIVLLGGAFVALRSRKPVVEVTAARAAGGTDEVTALNASGYITPRRRATVAAKITGRVTGVFFDEGNNVKEGQLLATLDDSDAQKSLAAAKADEGSAAAAIPDLQVQLRLAEIQLKRTQGLVDAKVQTQEALDSARASVDSLKAKIALAKQQVEAAQARIAEAQQAVDNCTIRAPFAGRIVSKDAQVGEMVSPVSAGGGFTRTGIATIVDMKSNEIEVDVNEAYIAKVKDNQRVEARLDAYPDDKDKYAAHVRTIIPSADRQKATVKVRISIDKLDSKVLPDMGVKVAFLEDEPPKKKDPNAVVAKAVIPQSAVRKDGGSTYVLLVKNGALERRGVTLGAQRGSDVDILAGVNAGDTLVVKGPEDLKDGQAVEIKQ